MNNQDTGLFKNQEKIFYNTDDYKMIKLLEDNYKDILSEIPYFNIDKSSEYKRREEGKWFGTASKEDFYKYIKNLKSDWYEGWQGDKVWYNFPLMIDNFVIDGVEQKCPKTIELLRKINCNRVAGYALLLPGGSLYKHTDPTGKKFNSMAGNLLLTDSKKSNILIWETEDSDVNIYNHKEGKMVIFDSTYLHSADNNGDEIRVILYIDFNTSEISSN